MLTLATTGLLLGWSVAWPPGPVNAEIVRRCLDRGFWTGFALGLGACFGDGLWALAVGLGAGVLLASAALATVLTWVSLALLIGLGLHYLHGAFRRARAARAGASPAPAGRFDSTRGGFLLGLTLALSSPWNIAFWLAVMGQPAVLEGGLAGVFVMAAAVPAGAAAWCVALCTTVVVLRRPVQGPAWDVATRAVTGLLLLAFAAASLRSQLLS